MRHVVAWAIASAPGMNVLMIALLVVGGAAFWQMRREVFPAFELELVTISIPYPGATPEDSEEAICQKIGHAAMGMQLTMFSMFGMVALSGVVINDSIVFVDFVNARVREGVPLIQALIESGERRFRPIMLTSMTTIAGLTPLMMETSFQARFLIPMATSLTFGLLVGTSLILLLVPTFYLLYDRLTGLMGVRAADDTDLMQPH